MERNNGPWKIKASATRYKDDFMEVIQDNVIKPDGKAGTYGVVRMKPGVAVLAVDEDEQVYFVRQFRYAVGRESLEIVCGGIDGNEAPEKAAARELKEELGIEASDWTSMGCFDLDTSMVNNLVHLFIARKLRFKEPEQEGSEVMRPMKAPFPELVQMVMDGRITHGISCVLILKAHVYKEQAKTAQPGQRSQ